MSQFSFPRINFHGQIMLDTPTANNGKFAPLVIFNQPYTQSMLPPLVMLDPTQAAYVQTNFPKLTVVKVDDNTYYVPLLPISSADLFNQWAVMPLGTSPLDTDYHGLYQYVPCGDSPNGFLVGIIPGYWNYFGDLSVTLQNVLITGVQLPAESGGVNTWTSANQIVNGAPCPPALAQLFGGSLSFSSELTNPNSRTTAVFCDVDSEGQTCTQIFYGQAGLVNPSTQQTFLSGSPCKSTANWMNLSKVLNWSDKFLIPMGGSATFYSTIKLDSCDSSLQALFNQYAGETVESVFMKLHIHRVHEVRFPDYTKMPTTPVGGNNANVPKNPARAYVTGSICSWKTGDMKTNSICRILKNRNLIPITVNPNMIVPPTKGGLPVIQIPPSVNVGPVFLNYDITKNLFSLDVINTIAEYGTAIKLDKDNNPEYPAWAGNGDVPYFTEFESYNFGKMDLYWKKDGTPLASLVGSFDFDNNYKMEKLIATGGMVDIAPAFFNVYSQGTFYISISINGLPPTTLTILTEDEIFITSDQQGTYSEYSKTPTNVYMNDGLPLVPITMRAFYRGAPIAETDKKSITLQSVGMVSGAFNNSNISIYDGMPFNYDISVQGCMFYGFVPDPGDVLYMNASGTNIFWYFANTFLLTSHVLSEDAGLQTYINNPSTITWQVVYNNVFKFYQAVLPIMNAVQPFTEANWSDPNWLARMVQVIDEKYWNTPRYMAVTRDLTANQRALLQAWAQKFVNT